MISGRILALDVGDKTIGLAVSDSLGITAQGLFTIRRTGIKKDLTKVLEALLEYECTCCVVGLPLKLDGTDSVQTEKVREFVRRLENRLTGSGHGDIRVELQDESLSTWTAEQALIEGGLSREKRKGIIDRQAAVVILQDYLTKIN